MNVLVENKGNDNICFEGYLRLLHQSNKYIGRVKVRISYSNQQFSPDVKIKNGRPSMNNLDFSGLITVLLKLFIYLYL